MLSMGRIAAPKCQHEGCQNPTWYGLCHHHQSGTNGSASPSVLPGTAPTAASTNFLHYASVSDLWSDLSGAFPDVGEVVKPATIRQETLDTLSAAVDNEAYRRFPALDVADYNERERLVGELREQLVNDLLPEASTVTGSEARELSFSSSDQYGRSAEDSRYLASFALNAEWECQRIMGEQTDPSFEHFVEDAVPAMRDAIDLSFRRNLGEFSDIIQQVTGRNPQNPDPIAPHLVVAPSAPAEDSGEFIVGQVVEGDTSDATAGWSGGYSKPVGQQGQPQGQLFPPQPVQPPQSYQPYPPQQAPQQGYQPYPNQQQQPEYGYQPEPVGDLMRRGLGKLKEYIEDPDGVHTARRLTARAQREEQRAIRQKAEDEKLERDLKRALLEQRQNRNRRNRGWF